MSRFTIFGFLVLLCVLQVLADKKEEQAEEKGEKLPSFLRKAEKEIKDAEKAHKKYKPIHHEPPVSQRQDIFKTTASVTDNVEEGSSAMRTLRRQTQITRHPCTCNPQSESCSCCGRVDQASTNFHARGCGIVRYGRRRNRSLRYEVSMNNRTVGRTEATGRDPEPICHPFPRYPYTDICWRFHTTNYDENGQLRFCLSVDARFAGYTFYTMNFECMNYDTANPESSSRSSKKSH